VSTAADAWELMFYVKDPFSFIVEFNYPWTSPTFSVANPLSYICEQFLTAQTSLQPLRAAMNLRYNVTGTTTCFQYKPATDRVSPLVDVRTLPTYEAYPWLYIVCTEFPLPHNGQGIFVFPDPYNFDAFSKQCMTLTELLQIQTTR
jgi:hypothetical protein